jgi:hypothetical protein
LFAEAFIYQFQPGQKDCGDIMHKGDTYQVWLRGSSLAGHVNATSKTAAMTKARDMILHDFNLKRVPAGTCVCKISPGYYEKIAEMNRKAGFNATTDF